VEQWLRPVCLV